VSDPIDKPYLETVDPTAAQSGVDAPGPQAAFADLINYGIYNGNFRLGPPNPASNIDLASSTSGSNFIPGWRFVQSSNTTITLKQQRAVDSPAGSNLRFTYTGAVSGHAAYLEQLVDVGGSAAQWTSNTIRAYAETSTAFAELAVKLQYLTVDGTITGMPPEVTSSYNGSPITAITNAETDTYPAPKAARYLRVRVVATTTGSFTGTLDLYEVRRERGGSVFRLSETYLPTSTAPTSIFTRSNDLYAGFNTGADPLTGTNRVLSRQLIAIPFVLLNVAAGATTAMQLSDNALGLANPYIGMIVGGSVVGVSYRLSTAITAGGAQALRIRALVGGSSVWTAHTLTTASAVSGEAKQPIATDDFTAGQTVGLDVVTSASFAPTTLDMAGLLWVALKYSGE